MQDILHTIVKLSGHAKYIAAFSSMSRAVSNHASSVSSANVRTQMFNVNQYAFINRISRSSAVVQMLSGRLRTLASSVGITAVSIKTAGIAFAALAVTLSSIFVMKVVKEFDLLRMQLSQIFGGSGAGELALNWSKKFAATGKSSVDSLVGAFRFLTRVGIQPTVEIMETLADVSAMTKKYTMADVAKAAAYAVQMNQWQMMHRTVGIHKRMVMAKVPEAFDSDSIAARIVDQEKAWKAIMELMQAPHFKGAAKRRADTTVVGRQEKFKAMLQNTGDAFRTMVKPAQLVWIKLLTQGFKMLKPILGPILMGLFKIGGMLLRIVGVAFRFVNVILRITKLDKIIPAALIGVFILLEKILWLIAKALEIICYWLEKFARWLESIENKVPVIRELYKWAEKLMGNAIGKGEIPLFPQVEETALEKFTKWLKFYDEKLKETRELSIETSEMIGDSLVSSLEVINGSNFSKRKEFKIAAILQYRKALDGIIKTRRILSEEFNRIKANARNSLITGTYKEDMNRAIEIQKAIRDGKLKELDIYKKIYDVAKNTKDEERMKQEVLGGGDLAKLGIRQWEMWKKIGGSMKKSFETPKYKVDVKVDGEDGLKGFVQRIAEQILTQNAELAAQYGTKIGAATGFSWR